MTGPRTLDRADALPLWAQLLRDLRRRLADGEFATSFPGELALVEEYEVSRHTVREALRRLRDEGLVVAGRGRTPRVAEPVDVEQPVGALYSLFTAVETTGQTQYSVVRKLDRRADAVISEKLGLDGAAPLIHLERLRLADDRPLAVDRVWLPADLAAPLLDVDFSHTALYDELVHRCGIRVTGGEEHIRAVVPSAAERNLLGVEPGVAAFAIDRLGVADGRPVEWRHTLVRGDRFGLSTRFSGREGYQLGFGHSTRTLAAT